jgi:cation diffusion facilitator family transporter
MENKKIAYRVSITTIIINSLLAVIKLLSGIISSSSAMVSDAIHTFSDVATTIIAMIGVAIGSKKDDDNHQYGHERIECIASLILSMILFVIGIEIGFSGIKILINNNIDSISEPGLFALIAAIISIIVKELMYWYTIVAAKKINSSALKADAWHHRSDALSSVGALIGIILSRMGYKYFDPLASIIISLFICKVAIEIFLDATDKLVDKSWEDDKIKELETLVLKQKGVLRIDDIKTRVFANKVYVDIEIAADGEKTLYETHNIAEKVHNKVEKKFKDVKHIMVHVNPYEERK